MREHQNVLKTDRPLGLGRTTSIGVIALFSLLAASSAIAALPEPFRAVYLHPVPFADARIDPGLRAGRMAKALDDIRACGFSTLLPYANTSGGRTYYPSELLQPAAASGEDTLGQLAHEARARGLNVMPVVCVLVSGHDNPEGILEQHPEWALRELSGKPMGWISPAHPEARAWVVRLVTELRAHIQSEGILLDYLRYPNKPVLLDPQSAEAFDAAAPAGESEQERKERLQHFKEGSLTALAADISGALRAQQPGIQIGLYTWGPHVPNKHSVAQRWPDWVRDKHIDLVNVSGYCYRKNYGDEYLKVFEKRVHDSVEWVRKAGVAIPISFALGIHTSHGALESPGEIWDYLAAAQRAGCPGVAAFAWASLEKFVPDIVQAGYFRDAMPPPDVKTGWRVRVTADFGKDIGQNFGSLFEAIDTNGRVVAGAGFLGAYNSYYRADRHTLHCFVRPPRGVDAVQTALFPRPTEACHHYLFDSGGEVYATTRASGSDVLRWDASAGVWARTEPAQAPVFQIGDKRLELSANCIKVDGREAFRFDPATGTAGSYYYAQGALFFHVAETNSPERRTRLHACAWNPESEPEPHLEQSVILPLTAPGEFPYSYGQLGNAVFVGSNNGGIYRFREGTWATLRPADPKTSFQLYAMINYRNRLLMGHYPSGELFEVVDDKVEQIAGWPPRPKNASSSAREAQTLTLYRGDLFAGVWPWGEVWRLKDNESAWEFVGRLFQYPSVESRTTAPYEAEMTQLGEKINNFWGQRVTALAPFRDGLVASTSNKNGAPNEERLSFLAGGRWQDYGAMHRLYLPGHLSAATTWTGKPAAFEVLITPDEVSVMQDARKLGAVALSRGTMEGFSIDRIRWGDGVFGPFQGQWSGESLERIEP